MTQLIQAVPFLVAGLITIILIDTLGAYASRRFHFNYGYLALLSIIVYIFIGYFLSQKFNLTIALLVNLALAFFDATIGWKLSLKLKPPTGLDKQQLKTLTPSVNLSVMLVFSFVLTFIGYLLA